MWLAPPLVLFQHEGQRKAATRMNNDVIQYIPTVVASNASSMFVMKLMKVTVCGELLR